MRRFTQFILRYRHLLSAILLACLAGSLWSLPRARLDLSIIPILEANEEVKREVEDFFELFPPRQFDLICVMEWDHAIGRAELEALDRIREQVLDQPHVADSLTLASTPIVENDGGLPAVYDFIDLVGEASALEVVEDHPLLAGSLISTDGMASPLLILSDFERGAPERAAWLGQMEAFISARVGDEVRLRFFGGDVVERAMSKHIRSDMLQSVLLEALAFLILLPLLFRTVRGLVIPLFAINSAVALYFGFMFLVGRAITPLGVAIPGLIVIIALSDAIHLLHRFEEALKAGEDKTSAICSMMENVGQACFYTSLTTGVGFLSLLVASHSAVRDFAISAFTGVVFAFITVVFFLPLMLSYWPVRKIKSEGIARID